MILRIRNYYSHQLDLSVQVAMPSGPLAAHEMQGPPHLYPKGLLDVLHFLYDLKAEG